MLSKEAKNSHGGLSSIRQGSRAEHLVIAELLSQGYPAFLSGGSLKYDVVVEVNSRLHKIQVKSTMRSRLQGRSTNHAYMFKISSNRRGHLYQSDDYDILALVALDINQVAYMNFSDVSGMQKISLGTLRDLPQRSKKTKGIYDHPFSEVIKKL